MKKAIKTILVVLITVIAVLAIILVFKGIANQQFIRLVEKLCLCAGILIVLSVVFHLAKRDHSQQ